VLNAALPRYCLHSHVSACIGFGLLLQMFTHVSPTPFVSEQNRLKNAKMRSACFGWCVAVS
jgi:hypothetical protein